MKTTPSGLQFVFLLFAIEFGAMLVASAIAKRVDVPEAFFATLGILFAFPMELALVFAIPAFRGLVLGGLQRPLTGVIVGEAVGVVGMKLAITFGVWGAIALWGLHVSLRSSDLASYGFFLDRASMDAAYFSTWGLITAGVAVTLGPVVEEILYRGVLYRLWERQWGWMTGAVLSALVFSAIHPHNMVQTFLAAIVYACLYRRTGTLWASIVCHIGYNLAVTWPLLGHVLQVKPAEAATSIGPWIPNLVCLAVGSIAFIAYVGLAARKPAPEAGPNADMSAPLFRAEAHDSRATSWLGTIVLMRPVPTVVMTAAASTVALAIVAFLVWGESTNKARVTGFLTPTRGIARVVATQPGVIESRFVSEGDSVAKGAPLVSLVDPRATDEHGTVGAQVATSLRERQRALSRQRDLAGTTYLADLDSLATRRAKLDAEARKLEDEIDAMRSRSKLAAEEIERAAELERSGFASRAMTDRKRDESLDVRIRISALERARDAARREAMALQSEAAAAKSRYLAQLAALDGQRASLGQERAERSAAYRSVVTAPHAGIVASMLVETGQAATQGTPLLTLLPADGKLEAHLFAPSRSIGFVRTGQAVLLRYPAFPSQKFGSQHAHVAAVSRSALAPGDLGFTPPDGNRESLYRIRATLDSQAILAYGKPEPLQAGMLVEADILLDRRRLIEWIFDPLLSLSGRL